MNDWSDSILSDLEAFLVRPDGSPARLLQIFSEIISKTAPMQADTPEELNALQRASQLLMDMFPGGSSAICEQLREMRQVLAMWNLAREEGIPDSCGFMSSDERSELLALREENALLIQERNRLEDALQKAEDALHMASFRQAPAAADPDAGAEPPPRDHAGAAPAAAVEPAGPDDPFPGIAAHLLVRVNLNTHADIPADAAHVLVTQAAKHKKSRIVKGLTFYNLRSLKTVEFDCEVHAIESGAFYHQGPLALKFRDPVCVIDPQAFSDKTRITLICAPPSNHADSLQLYAGKHQIPFIPVSPHAAP